MPWSKSESIPFLSHFTPLHNKVIEKYVAIRPNGCALVLCCCCLCCCCVPVPFPMSNWHLAFLATFSHPVRVPTLFNYTTNITPASSTFLASDEWITKLDEKKNTSNFWWFHRKQSSLSSHRRPFFRSTSSSNFSHSINFIYEYYATLFRKRQHEKNTDNEHLYEPECATDANEAEERVSNFHCITSLRTMREQSSLLIRQKKIGRLQRG